MLLLIISFLAWILTILAPCVLPLLPIILWASAKDSNDKYKPYIIISSLIISIVLFSLLLKASTIFIGLNPIVWKIFSWVILIVFWIITIFPNLWKTISNKFWLSDKSNQNLSTQASKTWIFWSIMVWLSLWPVFSSCSPTYAVILAVILPTSFFIWILNLFAYWFGLWVMLLLIAIMWQKIVQKTKWASSPNSIFKKILWLLFLLVWIAIITWFDKQIETKILDSWYFDVTRIEQNILDKVDINNDTKNILNSNKYTMKTIDTMDMYSDVNLEKAYFAWWCFWCMEWIFESQAWVKEAIAWYIGWDKDTANYDDVSTWTTKHREAIEVIYDPNIISFEKLVELYWTQIDPTDDWWQFADRWFQYTTAMFYSNDEEKQILEKSKENLEKSWRFDEQIATKILPVSEFYEAEEYHQDYYKNSSFRYNIYKKWSWREGFIEDNWEDRIEELESDSLSDLIEISWYQDYSPDKLKNTNRENIVLFFHASWCPTCKAFEENILRENIPDNILILKVDYDTEIELKKKYNIVTQTSFVLVDNKWNLKFRWIWARNIDDIIEKINEYKSWEINSKTYTDEELRAMLTPMQYKVAVEWWTEPPFDNEYWDNHEEWIYVDIIDKTPLFSSTDKFDSGTGWPSFTKPIDENFIDEQEDNSYFMTRTEVKTSSSHLWHVFEDWPEEKWWLRYCINSAALEFVPKDELEERWYWKYLELFN